MWSRCRWPAVFEEPQYEELRRAVLQDLSLLISYFPQLATVISSHGVQELTVDGREFTQIFTQTLPVIRLLGIDILLPKSLQHLLRPTLSMTLDAGDEKGITKHFLSMDETATLPLAGGYRRRATQCRRIFWSWCAVPPGSLRFETSTFTSIRRKSGSWSISWRIRPSCRAKSCCKVHSPRSTKAVRSS